ncbi:MAG: type III-A CRISPR-associated protein Csm2 [Phascolarctobacterium sp.]|nr:type III-A CRISPR-associated protein Csm2 [Phascolarctobacterium sp.]
MEYDVVDKAERTIVELDEKGYVGKDKTVKDRFGKERRVPKLTNSQIRKFLTAVNVVKNKVDMYLAKNNGIVGLPSELAAEIKFLRVNIIYQAAKDNSGAVKNFIMATNVDRIIDDIGNDANKFNKFCKYVEALVAFHKFYGGRD